MTAINWGAPLVFNFQAAREQGIIDGKTPTLVTAKNSPTNSKLSTREGRWDSVSMANAIRVQFPSGDPAYAAIDSWGN